MARLNGRDFTRAELMKRVGEMSPVADARLHTLQDGKAKGVDAVGFTTGTGFDFTVLPSRGMDIAWASFKGIPLAFISKTGVVGPQYYHEHGSAGFLRNFHAGLLTTCGFTHMGAACVDEGEELALHGPASNLPAEEVAVTRAWEGDEYVLSVRGKVRQARFFGENLVLSREISTRLGSKTLRIRDRVENAGFDASPFMLLYHINLGWPLVDERTRLHGKTLSVLARDAVATKGLESFDRFQTPTHEYPEQCFYLDHSADADGIACAGLFNPALGADGVGLFVAYDKRTLPCFAEWKMMGEQDYAVGLEPGTWHVTGRADARRRGELDRLAPGESREFSVEIGVVEGEKELHARFGNG